MASSLSILVSHLDAQFEFGCVQICASSGMPITMALDFIIRGEIVLLSFNLYLN